MKMKIALKNVLPNPFRHLDRYPIREEKIEALEKSIKDTDFWENIVARDAGNGQIEIAYGHHRMVALRNLYPDTQEFDFILKKIDDTNMCKIMAHENMDEWGSDAAVEQETVRAIIEGYADGRINLPELSEDTPKNKIRNAPHFIQGEPSSSSDERPYTSTQLMEFLGWKEWKVKAVLAALEKIEKKVIDEKFFEGISSTQQQTLTTEINKVEKKAEIKAKIAEDRGQPKAAKKHREAAKKEVVKVAEVLSEGFKTGTLGTRDAPEKAAQVTAPIKPTKDLPDISPAAERLGQQLVKYLSSGSSMGIKVRELITNRKHISDASKRHLQMNLRELADEANELANKLIK